MFQCQQLWIDMQRLRPKAAVLFYSSSTTPERIDNRRGRKTSFSRLGSISAPECTTAWSCCILRTGPAELSELHHLQKNDHILKAISLPVYNHVWLRGETLHLCAERCFILQKKKSNPRLKEEGAHQKQWLHMHHWLVKSNHQRGFLLWVGVTLGKTVGEEVTGTVCNKLWISPPVKWALQRQGPHRFQSDFCSMKMVIKHKNNRPLHAIWFWFWFC